MDGGPHRKNALGQCRHIYHFPRGALITGWLAPSSVAQFCIEDVLPLCVEDIAALAIETVVRDDPYRRVYHKVAGIVSDTNQSDTISKRVLILANIGV